MVKMKEVKQENEKGNFRKILKGSAFSILVTLFFLLIYSILLTYTNLNEKTMPAVIIIITALSILIGSLIATHHIKKKGIINGGLVGLIYILFLYFLSSIVGNDFSLNIYSIIMIIASIVAGAIGGIIGVSK